MEAFVAMLADPNVAYLLFTLGVLGLAAELYNPGLYFPGVIGALALALALVGFGHLPIAWAGIVLLVVAMGLLVAELQVIGFGALGLAGLAAFALGSLLLFDGRAPGGPAAQVSPWLIATMTALVAAFFFVVLRKIVEAGRGTVRSGVEGLIGQTGVAASPLAPTGRVRVGTEEWSAEAPGEVIASGAPVEVIGVSGVTLRVRPGPALRPRPERSLP
jgi:membrane-bound serine protease (ClpP class)